MSILLVIGGEHLRLSPAEGLVHNPLVRLPIIRFLERILLQSQVFVEVSLFLARSYLRAADFVLQTSRNKPDKLLSHKSIIDFIQSKLFSDLNLLILINSRMQKTFRAIGFYDEVDVWINWLTNKFVELSILQGVRVNLANQLLEGGLQRLAEKNSIVSFDELVAISLDLFNWLSSISQVMLPCLGLMLLEDSKVISADFIHIIPKSPDKGPIFSFLSLVFPALVKQFIHSGITYSIQQLLLVLVDLLEPLLQRFLVLLLIVYCHLLPAVDEKLSILDIKFHFVLVYKVYHFLSDLIVQFFETPGLFERLLYLSGDRFDVLKVVTGRSIRTNRVHTELIKAYLLVVQLLDWILHPAVLEVVNTLRYLECLLNRL